MIAIGNHRVHKGLDVILDLVVKDKAKARVGIDAARFVMLADPDLVSAGPYTIERKITTAVDATNGQVTDGPNGEASFFINAADQTGITMLAKQGAYFYQVAVRKTSDSKFAPVRQGEIYWEPSMGTWTVT